MCRFSAPLFFYIIRYCKGGKGRGKGRGKGKGKEIRVNRGLPLHQDKGGEMRGEVKENSER